LLTVCHAGSFSDKGDSTVSLIVSFFVSWSKGNEPVTKANNMQPILHTSHEKE